MRRRTNEALLRSGVTMLDPTTTFVDTTVKIGRDVTLFPGAAAGQHRIGDGTEIGPNTRLVDCTVGANAVVEQTSARRAHHRRRGPTWGPTPTWPPARRSPSGTSPDRSTIRPTTRADRETLMELVTKKRLHLVAGRNNRRSPRRSRSGWESISVT